MPKGKKSSVSEPEIIEPANSIANVISQVGSVVSSATSSIYVYLTTPAPFPPKPTNSRHITPYEANIVPSIALPERPKLEASACKTFHSNVPSASTFSNVLAFFSRTFTPSCTPLPLEEKPLLVPPVKMRQPANNDIDVKMKRLVSQVNAMKRKDPKKVEDIYIQQIDLVEYEIMEHAQRRADLYFYLLVAVYKQGANIVKVFTQKQHGAGTDERGTHACHDSFFPNILLQYPQTKLSYLWSAIVTPWAFSGTHFEDANNMTTELPAIVNHFDSYMESSNPGHRAMPSKFVKNLLEDLNRVSRGEMTPIDGMNSFITIMKSFFTAFEKKLDGTDTPEKEEKLDSEKKLKFPNAMHRAMRKIWELQQTGTLRVKADDSDSIDLEYLCSLLRVPPAQVLKAKQDPLLLLNYYCPIIQKEIFTTKSVIGPDRKMIKTANIK